MKTNTPVENSSVTLLKYPALLVTLALLSCIALPVKSQEVNLRFVETSDIHGNYYPYDFIGQKSSSGGLSRVYSLVKEGRKTYGDKLVLIDNGDILQGQPSAYYYNYIDTVSRHLCAEMMNYMGYDAGNMGNHDIETGRTVFDRWIGDCDFPVLGANIIDAGTGEPYLKPYIMLERDGFRIAIMGMITPAIPVWLSENLWKGLRFDDMESTARYWMNIIREKEKPDLIVGTFHAGRNPSLLGGKYMDNASLQIAKNIPGFDIVMMGHDHSAFCEQVTNVEGKRVWVVNPANNGSLVAVIDASLQKRNGTTVKEIQARLEKTDAYEPDPEFLNRFDMQYNVIKDFVGRKIGTFSETISTRESFFGPSGFVDFIHNVQLETTGADISFVAPLVFDTEVKKGDINMSDLFKLYKYENMLYVMNLTGKEIKDYLEYSYYTWTNQMKKPEDHLLNLNDYAGEYERIDGRTNFIRFSYNYDSAAGILYTVDVTRPRGEKIQIASMADGTPFDPDKTYRVAVNSYRGNGGGELLTKGAGIPQEKLSERIVYSSDKDLRYILMRYIEKNNHIDPLPLNQWMFEPREWVIPAGKRDYNYLFPSN